MINIENLEAALEQYERRTSTNTSTSVGFREAISRGIHAEKTPKTISLWPKEKAQENKIMNGYTESNAGSSVNKKKDSSKSKDKSNSSNNHTTSKKVGRGRPLGSKNKPKPTSAPTKNYILEAGISPIYRLMQKNICHRRKTT